MTGVDLVAGVLTRISELEALADAEDRDYAHTTLLPTFDSDHQAAWETDAVRRLCRAHRQIVDACQGELSGDNGPAAYTLAEWTLKQLAVGLGVVEEDRNGE